MDVRFCEGRNHRREARVRAAGSARVRRARSSEARLRRIFFSLTKTYMEVGDSEADFWFARFPSPRGLILPNQVCLTGAASTFTIRGCQSGTCDSEKLPASRRFDHGTGTR